MNKLCFHYMEQPLAAAGQAPEWIHLLPAGTFSGADGRGPYTLRDVQGVMERSMRENGGKLALDENHSTDTAALQGNPSPAMGWIVELQARDDGIWGRVDWNEAGRDLMAKRAYRGISPVFNTNVPEGGRGDVKTLFRAALTNTPNLNLHPLHHQQPESSSLDLAKLRKALGLADDAGDDAILAAAETQRTTISTHAQDVAAVTAAAGSRVSDLKALAVELQTRQANAGDAEKLRGTVVELQSKITTLETARSRDAATAFIDGAIRDGKQIAPLRDHYIERHMKDAASVEKEIGALVSIHSGGFPPGRHDDGGDGAEGLTADEMSMCRHMGMEPKKFAAEKKKRAEEQAKKGGR